MEFFHIFRIIRYNHFPSSFRIKIVNFDIVVYNCSLSGIDTHLLVHCSTHSLNLMTNYLAPRSNSLYLYILFLSFMYLMSIEVYLESNNIMNENAK